MLWPWPPACSSRRWSTPLYPPRPPVVRSKAIASSSLPDHPWPVGHPPAQMRLCTSAQARSDHPRRQRVSHCMMRIRSSTRCPTPQSHLAHGCGPGAGRRLLRHGAASGRLHHRASLRVPHLGVPPKLPRRGRRCDSRGVHERLRTGQAAPATPAIAVSPDEEAADRPPAPPTPNQSRLGGICVVLICIIGFILLVHGSHQSSTGSTTSTEVSRPRGLLSGQRRRPTRCADGSISNSSGPGTCSHRGGKD